MPICQLCLFKTISIWRIKIILTVSYPKLKYQLQNISVQFFSYISDFFKCSMWNVILDNISNATHFQPKRQSSSSNSLSLTWQLAAFLSIAAFKHCNCLWNDYIVYDGDKDRRLLEHSKLRYRDDNLNKLIGYNWKIQSFQISKELEQFYQNQFSFIHFPNTFFFWIMSIIIKKNIYEKWLDAEN